MTKVLVRAVQNVDLPRIVRLDATSQASPWSSQRFHAELALDQSRLTLAELDGEIGGYLCAWEIAGEIEIQNIVTATELRRRGIARALLDDLLRYAGERGVCRLLLEVRNGNRAAIALYRHYGFTDSGIRRGYYADGENALLMEKALSSR